MVLYQRIQQGLLIGFVTSTLFVAGCQGPTKGATGAVLGGVAGGALGSQVGSGRSKTAATIGGVLAGAALGGVVGNSMDKTDELYAKKALDSTPTGQAAQWHNKTNGHEYKVIPTKNYDNADGQSCRDYTTTAIIDGQEQTVNGSACRQSDGTWETTGSTNSVFK
ncbi:MAG: RT0821/Lpp0805 family surface protein [Thiotrichaceae bacterium]|nr:RT0821/Lpp0805 family surface protein [Thiotrichaceae bacterium]